MCHQYAYNAGEILTILEGRLIPIFVILVNSRLKIVSANCSVDIPRMRVKYLQFSIDLFPIFIILVNSRPRIAIVKCAFGLRKWEQLDLNQYFFAILLRFCKALLSG